MGTGSVLWEVISPVVRWPLWSPRRLIATVAVLALVLLLWSRTSGSDGAVEASELEAPSEASDAASAFMGAWGDPTASRGEWRSGVQALGTDEVDRAWSRTDPSKIPVSVVEEMTPVEVSETRVTFSVATDGPQVQLVTVKESSGWKVASIEPEVAS